MTIKEFVDSLSKEETEALNKILNKYKEDKKDCKMNGNKSRDGSGNRDHQYGSPEDNFNQIARFWSLYLHTDLTSCDVDNMMILFKLARNMTGEPNCQCYYEKGFTDYTDIRQVITKMKC